MQVSVETMEGLERKITVGLPAAEIEQEINKRLQHLSRTQKIQGFRPGKVPMSVIRQRFGQPVRQEVSSELMQRSFFDAAAKENLKPAGMPRFKALESGKGEDFQYEAVFEVFPEIKIENLDSIEVEKPKVEITDADLDEMLLTLRKQRQTWQSIDRKLQNDDKAVIDFKGMLDGEVFEGGSAEGFALTLGSNSMIPGFEEGLLGKGIGETVTLELTFPEDYHKEDLKGKAVVFEVTIQSAEEPVLPELDDEFVKAFGIEEGGVDKLKEEVKKNMQRELEQTLKSRIKESAIEQLLQNNEIDVPKALIAQEVNVLRNQAMQQFTQGRPQAQMPEIPASLFEPQAKKRVQSGLLVSELVKEHGIKADREKVKEMVENLASAYEKPEEVVNWYYSNKQQLEQIEAIILEDQVVDLLCEKGKTIEKEMSFDELMNVNK